MHNNDFNYCCVRLDRPNAPYTSGRNAIRRLATHNTLAYKTMGCGRTDADAERLWDG